MQMAKDHFAGSFFIVYLFIDLFVKNLYIDCSRNVLPSTTQKAVYSSLSLSLL